MCGVVGIVGKGPVNQDIYDALTVLQHRGQDAAGIVTVDGDRLHLRKDTGLVSQVFEQRHMQRLAGRMGIGHVRYPTAGTSSSAEAQPMYVNSPYGISLAHNGNLTNADDLVADVFRAELRHVNTESDSEILLNVFAHELDKLGAFVPGPEHIFEAVSGVHARCSGAYAAVAMIMGGGIVGFRDPHGIRPLVYGCRDTRGGGEEYMIASESAALAVLGFEIMGDVGPGEAVYIDVEGHLHVQQCADEPSLTPCIFEHVYLARPDSIMDDISVHKARLRMGEKLADRILERFDKEGHEIDVVMPIPETSRTAAQPIAHRLDVKLREGFVKNRYVGRTFIMPGQNQRRKSVRQKLNAIDLEFNGKNVLLVEDSVVRGTTMQEIVQQAREAGARKVFVAVAAPPVRYPNVYGIDMPTATEFVAYNRTDDEVGSYLGADRLIYQSLDDLVDSAREGNRGINRFDCSVFDGDYVTGDIDDAYLERLSMDRNDESKQRRDAEVTEGPTVIELHNHA